MTWVIMQPTMFGQIVCLSDIQVTFKDLKTGKKTYKNCVQKMYAMDRNIIIGFAGNVLGGFLMLSSLSKEIKSNKDDADEVFEPEHLINYWSDIAKAHYKRLKPEASGDIHLIIGGISYSQDMGIPGMGKPTVAILKSPNFNPEFVKIGTWASIGSGSEVEKYKELLKKATGDPYHPLMQMETSNEGGFAQTLSIYISYEAQKMKPVKGVSQHFHIAIASRRGIFGGTSDHNEYLGTDHEISIKMPNIARSLDEFLEIMKSFDPEAIKAYA